MGAVPMEMTRTGDCLLKDERLQDCVWVGAMRADASRLFLECFKLCKPGNAKVLLSVLCVGGSAERSMLPEQDRCSGGRGACGVGGDGAARAAYLLQVSQTHLIPYSLL